MSDSLILRWLNHNRLKDFCKRENVKISWLEWVEDFGSIVLAERHFISVLVPPLNKQGIATRVLLKKALSSFNPDFTEEQNKFLTLTMSELARETDIDIARWSR